METAFVNLPADAQEALIQETARRLVSQEVRYCVSALISNLARREWDGNDGVDPDALASLFGREPDADDFRDAAPERVTVLQVEEEDDRWEWMGPNSDSVYTDDGGEYFDTEREAWESAFDANGWDYPDGAEALEHWLVTDWFAEKLKEHREAVSSDAVDGLTVWGRCTSGQLIEADGIVRRIARELLEA